MSSHLHRLYGHAVRVVCNLQKYDPVASSRHSLGWLSLNNLIKHHAAAVILMFRHYANSDCVVFDPPNEFGFNYSHDTWTVLFLSNPLL